MSSKIHQTYLLEGIQIIIKSDSKGSSEFSVEEERKDCRELSVERLIEKNHCTKGEETIYRMTCVFLNKLPFWVSVQCLPKVLGLVGIFYLRPFFAAKMAIVSPLSRYKMLN